MDKMLLDGAEARAIERLLNEATAVLPRLHTEEALHRATLYAHELPERVRLEMNAFRLERKSGVFIISGYEVDQERLGRTPAHWCDRPVPSPAHREEMLLFMLASLIGDPFCWRTQQNGQLIHDVIPIKGHEDEQLGSSSQSLLTWHTEDAFHPLRGDFLTFACLRNPYGAATTVGSVDSLSLSESVRAVLFEERFGIRPDESHLAKNNSVGAGPAAFDAIDKMQASPDRVAVLFGDPDRPYIRADPYFMVVDEDDHEARAALEDLTKAMDDHLRDLRLEAGDFCFIDNFRVVHGRKPFTPRHDGTDRWLKRINVTCDLRKSRGARLGGGLRSIG
jgi:Fe(II)/alpha-ketoglutarate-dependent arginine beta-hydroxylase